jgi:hypothetical protein
VLPAFGGAVLFPLPGFWPGDDGCSPLGGGWPAPTEDEPPFGEPPEGAAAIVSAADPAAKPAIARLENAIVLKDMIFLSRFLWTLNLASACCAGLSDQRSCHRQCARPKRWRASDATAPQVEGARAQRCILIPRTAQPALVGRAERHRPRAAGVPRRHRPWRRGPVARSARTGSGIPRSAGLPPADRRSS